jgi:hypothetical protein
MSGEGATHRQRPFGGHLGGCYPRRKGHGGTKRLAVAGSPSHAQTGRDNKKMVL